MIIITLMDMHPYSSSYGTRAALCDLRICCVIVFFAGTRYKHESYQLWGEQLYFRKFSRLVGARRNRR